MCRCNYGISACIVDLHVIASFESMCQDSALWTRTVVELSDELAVRNGVRSLEIESAQSKQVVCGYGSCLV